MLRWGQASRGSRGKRQVVRARLHLQAQALTLPPAVAGAEALRTVAVDKWLGLAERDSPLSAWFEDLLEEE
eukprot:3504276-Pyramimonas_sp.AAC.1